MSTNHGKDGDMHVREDQVTPTDFNKYSKHSESDIKVFKRRWFILFLLAVQGMTSGIQCIQMAIVEDVLVDYYQVDGIWIESTVTVWSLTGMVSCIPAALAVRKYGLRPVMVVSAFLNSFGCFLKSFSGGRESFVLAFVGQTVSSMCQALVCSLYSTVASVWFGPTEVSTASSIGLFGIMTGWALGFVIPPFVIQANPDKNVTRAGIDYLNWTLTGSSLIILVCILIWFQEKPSKPPSMASLVQREIDADEITFLDSLKQLARNPGYLIILVAYGIVFSIYYAFSPLLNSFILEFYPNGQKHAGGIGFTSSITGMFGVILSGWLLDKTKQFKEVLFANCFGVLVSCIGFTAFLDYGYISIQYITAGAFGFFGTSVWSVGYEVVTELTYPMAENISNGVSLATSQFLTVIVTPVAASLLPKIRSVGVLYSSAVLLGVGTFLVCLMPKNYCRLKINSLTIEKIKATEAVETTNEVT